MNISRILSKCYFRLVLCSCLCAAMPKGYGQDKTATDTVFFLAKQKGILGKIGKSLSVNNPDLLQPQEGAVKNEAAFVAFQGKIIRDIHVQKTGFSKSIYDTIKQHNSFFNDLGDALHTSTRTKVILNNLFFVKGNTLYPSVLSDNEAFLRQLSFLQDARIVVKPVPEYADSVDIIILCKDVFPIGGSVDEGSEKTLGFEINDDNLFGTGNRLQMFNYFDLNRNPGYGFGFEFLKRNISGTFINLALGYQNQAPAYNSGRREEKNIYLKGELPLVSPYHSWTGAFEIASHSTQNLYLPDSIYFADFNYHYQLIDGWLGHNIGAKLQTDKNLATRLRKLIALRAIQRIYQQVPGTYKGVYNPGYTNLSAALASYTVFEQDYYHTNFIYGFGRNEDVPEGFNLSVTGGWSMINNMERPYLGFEYQRNYFSNKMGFINYKLKLGSFYNSKSLEDVSILTSLEYFTKLQKLGKGSWWLRHFINGSITQLFNSQLIDFLHLSSDYGIPQLNNTDFKATTRATFNEESVFYNTWKFVGFSFAPFVSGNITYLKPQGGDFGSGEFYTAFGAGLRTRNENLVFGTIELKANYYPRTTGNMSPWNITLNTGLQFRYISQLVKRPDFVINN
ncbi:MAG: hypothetical protein RLZZ28_416 [Bacteroidota bacterium]